jgi:hypothetical protein
MLKRLAVTATVLLVSMSMGIPTVSAWGPGDRTTFTEDKPAGYITFNSITDDSNYGDERNFVLVKDAANTQAGGFVDVVNVEDDHAYLVRVFVHNNAAEELNLVAENVRLSAGITKGLTKNGEIEVQLNSSNADPEKIWDEVNLKADKEFQIAYIMDSGRYYTNANGSSTFTLGDEIVTSKDGVLLGYDKLDGKIPGCYQYTGIATFKVKVNFVKDAIPFTVSPATAAPTASTVLVNGKSIAFDAYNIGGNNYFKLRDLAYTLNGTPKQFEVGWNGAVNAIILTSGQAYTTTGGEMADKGAGGGKTATPTTSKITLDGKDVSFDAYNIGGNNYFKLRDIGQAFDFGVDWDGARNTVVIDTGKGYTSE